MFYPQKQLGATQSKFQQRIQEREKELQDLRQAVQSLKVGTDQRRRQQLAAGRAISGLSSSQPVRSPVLGHFPALWGSIPLSHSVGNRLCGVPSCQSLCAPPEPGDLPSITVSPHNTFEAVRKSVSELKERLEDV
ncbi:hypothetical protein GJAV_G00084940 [Gymnothorax javanicus]|nr:hypothetical protein GJAV_G00084940 [Gymnothorax javanicus]